LKIGMHDNDAQLVNYMLGPLIGYDK